MSSPSRPWPAPRHRDGSSAVERLGYLQIMAGIGLFGTGAVFIRLIDLPAPTIVATQGLLATLALVAIHKVRRPPMQLQLPRHRGLVVLIGTCFALDHILFTAAIQRTTVANIVTLVYLYPVLTVVLSVWLIGERVQQHVAAALALGVTGTVVILYPYLAEFRVTDLQASVMGLAVAFLAAFQRILVKRLHPSLPSLTVNLYKYGVISVLVMPGLTGLPGKLTPRTVALLVASSLISGVCAAFLVLSGVRKVEANKGAVLSYVEPVVALSLAWLVLSEASSPYAIVGGLCVFTSGYLVLRGPPADVVPRLTGRQ